jgi:hypothetical protein
MCTMLYRAGFADAIGQYCVGRAGKDLFIPALRLDPGRYFVAVLQDLGAYGGAPTFVQEDVSDTYSVLAEAATPEPGTEIEPNDQVASATELAPGRPCTATIGWARDEDVFCVPATVNEPIRWRVHAGFRDAGVLEATAIRGGEEGRRVRIHADGTGRATETDALSPWQSGAVLADETAPRCLRVRLAADPWSAERGGATPSGGSAPYVVEALTVR